MVVSGSTVKNNLQSSLNAINHNELNFAWSYIMAHAIKQEQMDFITYLI